MNNITWDFAWSPDCQMADAKLYNVDLEMLKKIMQVIDPNYTFDDLKKKT